MDYEITAPDGRRFVVTAPDGASPDDVLRYAQQNVPAREPSTLRQVAGNIAGAAARGVSNFIGLPGDVAQGMDRATDWLGQKVTGNPEWTMRPPVPPPTIAVLFDISTKR